MLLLAVYVQYAAFSLKMELWKIISVALHINSLNWCQQNIHFPASLFLLIYIRMERWEVKQWTFVGGWWWCSNEWLSHPWDAVLWLWLAARGWHIGVTQWEEACGKTGPAENPDKAAPLSCQQGVFELSPGEGAGRGGNFGRQSSE